MDSVGGAPASAAAVKPSESSPASSIMMWQPASEALQQAVCMAIAEASERVRRVWVPDKAAQCTAVCVSTVTCFAFAALLCTADSTHNRLMMLV
jgi:hypothetical protein